MPQEINIVLCYKCNLYQSQISKKAKQWKCVVCGEKQSLNKIYFTGSGKDCRVQVQKLNELRFAPKDNENEELEDPMTDETVEEAVPVKQIVSKWSKYLDDAPDE